jgi:putative ABC transport system ATP-binding protein
VIRLQGLVRTFNAGTPDEKRAIDGISLVIGAGEFVALIGGNGAGKSTLLNLIGGAQSPDGGSIEIDGRDVTGQPEHERAALVARVFQDPMLGTAPALTVEENLALAEQRATGRGWRRALTRARRDRYCAVLLPWRLGLEDRLSSPVAMLSGGQRQALALAMATLIAPRVLLLDEHTAALDPRTSALVMEATARVVGALGMTTLMVTHNMQHALDHCSRIVMLSEGRVRADLDASRKRGLTIADLVARFQIADDRLALS